MGEAQGGKAPVSEASNIGGQTPAAGLAVAVAAACNSYCSVQFWQKQVLSGGKLGTIELLIVEYDKYEKVRSTIKDVGKKG